MSGTQTWTVYDGRDPYADFDGSGTLKERYLYGPAVDSLLARTDSGGTTAWYLTDRLGTIRDVVDASGAVIDHVAYDSFGNVTSESSPSNGDRFKFTGREYDAATGLYYYRARYYDAATGRFASQDPAGFGGGDYNLFRYVRNSPTTGIDPSGRDFTYPLPMSGTPDPRMDSTAPVGGPFTISFPVIPPNPPAPPVPPVAPPDDADQAAREEFMRDMQEYMRNLYDWWIGLHTPAIVFGEDLGAGLSLSVPNGGGPFTAMGSLGGYDIGIDIAGGPGGPDMIVVYPDAPEDPGGPLSGTGGSAGPGPIFTIPHISPSAPLPPISGGLGGPVTSPGSGDLGGPIFLPGPGGGLGSGGLPAPNPIGGPVKPLPPPISVDEPPGGYFPMNIGKKIADIFKNIF